MRVVSFNVNGIRALARKGGVDRIQHAQADVVCLQEVRATADQMSDALAGRFEVAALAESEQRGRSGVAVLSSHPVLTTRIGLRGFENDGRWVEAVLDTPEGAACVVSVYVPKGYVGDPRQERKLRFLDEMTKRMDKLRREAEVSGVPVLVCGDLNVARTDHDLKNWKGNRGKSGVLPEEREFLEKWARAGWVDIGQYLAGRSESATGTRTPGSTGTTGTAGSAGNEAGTGGVVDAGSAGGFGSTEDHDSESAPGSTGSPESPGSAGSAASPEGGENPEGARAPYTWWSQRGRAFDSDAGWRIDYVWATPELATAVKSAEVDRAPAWDARWSDHAALIVDFA